MLGCLFLQEEGGGGGGGGFSNIGTTLPHPASRM